MISQVLRPAAPLMYLPAPGPSLIRLLVFLAVWEIVARTLLSGLFIVAAPSEIIAEFYNHFGLYTRALGATFREATLGFLWGNLAAIVLAGVALLVPASAGLVRALALVVFCLPLVATGPILRVLYGPGEVPQITLAALAVYYTTFVPLLIGMRATPSTWLELVRSYGRGRWTTLTVVRARAALPYLFAGLQIAAPAAFLGAMVGEFTGAERGLGVLTIQAMRSLDTQSTWAIATLATAVSVLAYWAVGALGRRLDADPPPILLAPPSAKAASIWRTAAGALGVIAVTLVLWHGAMEFFGLSPFFAKRPSDVFEFLVTADGAAAARATLLSALGETLVLALPGFLAGLALGFLLAALLALRPGLSDITTPAAVALRSVPIVVTAPLIVLALGRGAVGTIVIVAVMSFFPTFVACQEGLRRTPRAVLDVFAGFSASPLTTLSRAQIPAMMPAFFGAARMAAPAAVLAATVAEWLATGVGIGNLMALAASTSGYNMLWSCVVILTVVSVALYATVGAIERAVLSRLAPEQLAR